MRRLIALSVTLATLAATPALAQQYTPQQDQPSTQPPSMTTADPRADYKAFNPKAELSKGVEALKAKRYRGAIHSIGKVVDRQPKNVTALRLLAVAYAGADKWTYSRHAYERVLKVAPDDVVSHAGRGEALLALNDPRAQDEARWLAERARACGDTCPDAAILKTLQTRGPFARPAAG
jgi:tetratricopeptide (TPR) repeat protein